VTGDQERERRRRPEQPGRPIGALQKTSGRGDSGLQRFLREGATMARVEGECFQLWWARSGERGYIAPKWHKGGMQGILH